MKNPFDNPVAWLDSRSRVREKRLWILASFFVAVPLLISLFLVCVVGGGHDDFSPFPDFGLAIAGIAVFAHGALLVLLAALGSAQRISQERERRTLPALVNSPLTARQIATGKLLGAWRFVAWLAFFTLPFLAASSVWGGLPAWRVLACWLLDLAAAMAVSSFALGLSGLFGRSLSAYLATGSFLFLWCAVTPVFFGIVGAFLESKDLIGDQAVLAVSFFHLPLVPQAWLVYERFGVNCPGWLVFGTALASWTALAALGRLLAVRGLKREVL